MRISSLGAVAVSLAMITSAGAQVTLNAAINVDDLFTAYISTDDSVAGDSFLSGTSWPTTYTGSTVLTEPGTYYLHVFAQDNASPSMFLGAFTLSSPEASFENGTQSLVTDVANWRVSSTGFGANYLAPEDLGANGLSPWGFHAAQGASAHYIWHPSTADLIYFSTTITVVPAPACGAAFLLLGALRRRR